MATVCAGAPASSKQRAGMYATAIGTVSGEGLAKQPPRRCDVQELHVLAASGGHGEAELLANESGEGLPVGTPVPGHLDPPCVCALDPWAATEPLPARFLMLTSSK
ncbi:hypothetical protein PR202_gb08126 [Eleusine coracana subsp. coracana]|uniref:Uncharacterized protein n=1 Tax=Eleusine coracana subsp. coracana TaxID=191504 RepID=A0AAV5EEZ0_ELECO|nr:hypothetical protein PR202_gb08126 [Eleusine coracana subsp. coracana]